MACLGTFRTDEFGEILLTNVEPGTYRAVEVDTGNDGYILDTTPQEVELEAGDGIKELMFFNDVKPGLHLVKVDSADPSKVIPNVLFEIKSVAGDYGPEEFRTDENGEIDLSKLPAGAYVVTEKSCPGYVIDEAQRIIQLDPNEDAQFVFTNSIKPSLQLIKLSSDGSPWRVSPSASPRSRTGHITSTALPTKTVRFWSAIWARRVFRAGDCNGI